MTPERWQQVKAVYEAVDSAPPSARGTLLDRLCAGDEVLRGEVEQCLLQDRTATSIRGAIREEAGLVAQEKAASAGADASVPIGQNLGPYRVISRIGEGGMGEVYEARDTRLGRQVALKLLPPLHHLDRARLLRFQQEARASSALNHPNIVTIYDFGETESGYYIAMELVPGRTLRQIIAQDALPVQEILAIAVQITMALATAHAAGIVHRDIKPDNVMVRPDGYVKVLDFGLAKLVEKSTADGERTPDLSRTGMLMGTAAYMSPEQARGGDIDARSDLFSLGVVLYEMASRQQPFRGDTPAHVLTAILDQEPPALGEVAAVPGELEAIVHRCLRKDRDLRYPSAQDLLADLRQLKLKIDSSAGLALAFEPGRTRRRRWTPRLTGLLALIAASGLVWFARHRVPAPRPELRARRLTANPAGNPATDGHISPDGKYLAYADQAGIHLQSIESSESRTIAPPGGLDYKVTGWFPVGWFPDGTKLLAQATSLGAEHSGIWVVSILGGAPREIRKGALGWSVSPDGSLIAFSSTIFNSDIWLIGPNGEDPHRIVIADEGESLNSVVWSPDGRRIAYERLRFAPSNVRPTAIQCAIESHDLKGGTPSVVLSDPKLATGFGGGIWWLADRRLIYSLGETEPWLSSTDTNLWEVEVDAGSGKPRGGPRRISNWADFSLSGLNATADGKRIAFGRVSAQADIYVADLEAGGRALKTTPRRLTLDERNDWPTSWIPDSKSVLFFSDRSGNWNIYKQALDQDSAEPLVSTPQLEIAPRMSADGAWIIYGSFGKPEDVGVATPAQVRRIPVSGGPSELVMTERVWGDPRCARAPANLCVEGEPAEDQTHLVFAAFDPVKGRGLEVARIETQSGLRYNWDLSPDGSQIALLFPNGENRIRLVPLGRGAPRDLVVREWSAFSSGPDWAPDGKGFYVSSRSARGATLLYIDLEGHATAVWEQKGSFQTWGVPSPDGRHLAIMGYTVDSSVWMLENF